MTILWPGAVCALLLMLSTPVRAELRDSSNPVPTAARMVLERIDQAVTDGDHRALAALIHPDGVRIAMSPDPERIQELTPAQAHYYFKSLFQTHKTLSFEYRRHHTDAEASRILVRVIWRIRGLDDASASLRRLLLTVVRYEDDWRLTEFTELRGG